MPGVSVSRRRGLISARMQLHLNFILLRQGAQPIVLGDDGQEAVKIKNLYIYCQHIVRVK